MVKAHMKRHYIPICLLISFGLFLCSCGPSSLTLQPTVEDPRVTVLPTVVPGPTRMAPGDLPDQRANQASDVDSSGDAEKQTVPGGDLFVRDLYERPFNTGAMDTYFPYIDIVDTQVFKDGTWGYAAISLSGTDENGNLPASYGIELDLDKDGRGDWLILANHPVTTDWTTQGVQAWQDTNNDVGGSRPLFADKSPDGDGYETKVFDQGRGGFPDGAWVRRSSEDSKTVELAFKLSMLGNPDAFSLDAWAGTQNLDPAMFDFNDHMTHAQAGSPLVDYTVYPLKRLAEIDNTCRMAVGFPDTEGVVPGLCVTAHPSGPAPQPTSPPHPLPLPD